MTARALILLFTAALVAPIPLPVHAGPRPGGGRDHSGPPFHSTEDIRYAQKVLAGIGLLKAGAYKPGVLDDGTLRAIRVFQREHSIAPHGWLDLETMGMLTSHEKPPAGAQDRTTG